ncbi:hypothetical protein [Photorhabdus stackebrandtii]|uniref:hypothetical protein n=1 Tax=Photorhabdus stackebrandtii TaxID=1123042 RepID=UPI001F622163|nr:hypothetical protein [Photorhabdus stackebrandtii]
MTPAASLAPAIKDIASAQKTTFATTQAVWRFLNNDRISFSQLNQPMIELAQQGILSVPMLMRWWFMTGLAYSLPHIRIKPIVFR